MKTTSILIVDDEPELREILAFDFENAGFDVTCTDNGRKALELLASGDFSAVVSDIQMPELDGVELLNELRKKGSNIVLVFITGFSNVSVEQALDKGADAMFLKPFDRRGLIGTISRLLKSPRERWGATSTVKTNQLPALEVEFENFEEAVEVKALGLARGGMFVAAENLKLEVGSVLAFNIKFKNSGGQPIRGTGIIRWVRTVGDKNFPAGLGLEFTYLEASSLDFVVSELEKNSPSSFIPAN